MIKPLKSLKDKIEEKAELDKVMPVTPEVEEAKTKLDDKIDELVGDKKAKIKRTSLKKAK